MCVEKVTMIRDTINYIPDYDLPNNFTFRLFKGEEDIDRWVNIEYKAGEFNDRESALNRFTSEFEGLDHLLSDRLIFILNENDEAIGTIMAWFGNRDKSLEGRIHWVSLLPEYQGLGLSKSLLSKALKTIAINHDSCYLTTSNKHFVAINLYLKFGFKPSISGEKDRLVWEKILTQIEKCNNVKAK